MVHSNYEGFTGSVTSRNVSQISEGELWKKNFLGIFRSSLCICFIFIVVPLEERKKAAGPGKDGEMEACPLFLLPSPDFGACDRPALRV